MIWFGIFVVVVVEMAQITPPVGFNLFVMQGITGHDIPYIARAALPSLRHRHLARGPCAASRAGLLDLSG
jgi:TRAP-type C4-dicarboxylate transport system permease large subunit